MPAYPHTELFFYGYGADVRPPVPSMPPMPRLHTGTQCTYCPDGVPVATLRRRVARRAEMHPDRLVLRDGGIHVNLGWGFFEGRHTEELRTADIRRSPLGDWSCLLVWESCRQIVRINESICPSCGNAIYHAGLSEVPCNMCGEMVDLTRADPVVHESLEEEQNMSDSSSGLRLIRTAEHIDAVGRLVPQAALPTASGAVFGPKSYFKALELSRMVEELRSARLDHDIITVTIAGEYICRISLAELITHGTTTTIMDVAPGNLLFDGIVIVVYERDYKFYTKTIKLTTLVCPACGSISYVYGLDNPSCSMCGQRHEMDPGGE